MATNKEQIMYSQLMPLPEGTVLKKKVRSLRCHDDYGNENVKKAIDFE